MGYAAMLSIDAVVTAVIPEFELADVATAPTNSTTVRRPHGHS